MREIETEYLGDSVDVSFDQGVVYLACEHSDGCIDKIRLDPVVLAAFIAWLEDNELMPSEAMKGVK